MLVLTLMASRVRHTIKIKASSFKCTSKYQQSNLNYLQSIEDRFDESYNNDGEPGNVYDMEYHKKNQYFDKVSLPDDVPLDSGELPFDGEGNEYVLEGGDK